MKILEDFVPQPIIPSIAEEQCHTEIPCHSSNVPEYIDVGVQCDLLTCTIDVGTQCDLLTCTTLTTVTSVGIQTDQDPMPWMPPAASDILDSPSEVGRSDVIASTSNVCSIDMHPTTTNTTVSESISPQKSICSELTCTGNDTDSDDIYMPGSSAESQTETDTETDEESEKSPAKQRKFIVFEENLDKLFVTCSTCSKPVTEISKSLLGSMVVVHSLCSDGHQNKWQSQPTIDSKIGGNVLLAGAILFSGNSFQNISSLARCLNLAFIGKSRFYDIQKEFLFPVVDKAWRDHQENLLEKIKKIPKLDICGDGRCDSPGHCAKYGTYTVMSEGSNEILEFEVVQVTEVSSSNAMEAEGCNRVLNNLKDKGVSVRCLTTDRHTTITSEMRKKHSEIIHQYDVWHLSKWVVKKLTKKSKKKEYQDLSAWIQSVSSHFWWSVATCEGSYDVLIEKWTSVVHHVGNKHSWRGAKHFKKCAHNPLSRREVKEKLWLKPGTAAHVALEEVVFNKKLLKDLKLVTEFHHTGNLEVYHSMMLKYCPKRQHFSHEGMNARTQLAVLDHNQNCARKQAVVKQGSSQGALRYNLVFPKVRKTWVVKPIKEVKTYGHVDILMEKILKQKRSKGKKSKRSMPRNITTKEKPDKKTAIQAHISRFQPK